MTNFEGHLEDLAAQLKQWGANIDDFVAKSEGVAADAKSEYRYRIDDLKAKYQVAQAKFNETSAAGAEKWDTLKGGVEAAWSELETALKKVTT